MVSPISCTGWRIRVRGTDVQAISSRCEPYRDALGRHDRGQVGAGGMLLAVRRPDGLAYLLADWGIWAAFAAEYAAMVSVAPDRWRFVRTHPFDSLRWVKSAPLLRAGRLFRVRWAAGTLATKGV